MSPAPARSWATTATRSTRWNSRAPPALEGLGQLAQELDYSLGCFPIPFFRHSAAGYFAFQDLGCVLLNAISPVSRDKVRANLAGDGAFGVVAKRDARDAENGRFLLQPSTIRDDHHGIHI